MTRRPAWSKTCTRLLFPRSSVSRPESASRVCPRRCLRILTNTHARQLPGREPFVLFPGNPSASHVRNARCISFRRDTPHRRRIYLRIPGPAKLTRLLATCAASETLDPHRGHVKQFVTTAVCDARAKNICSERSSRGVTSPKQECPRRSRRGPPALLPFLQGPHRYAEQLGREGGNLRARHTTAQQSAPASESNIGPDAPYTFNSK